MFDELGGEVASFVLGVALTKASQVARNLRARQSREWPVAVHVEDDLEIIFANTPPWISAPTFLPGIEVLGPDSPHDLHPPTSDPLGLAMWARNELGGIPAGNSVMEMTVRSKSPVEVVFDRVSVKAEQFSPGPGVVINQPVGGASLEFRRFEIGLWDFASSARAVQPGGQTLVEHAATIRPGDPLRLQLQTGFENHDDDAYAYRWKASLHMLVAGKRKTIHLPRQKDQRFELINQRVYPQYTYFPTDGFRRFG
ncbi:hypothetical protein IRY31_03780 [Corynebacterium afermentans subsp. lipophilum]|uniref:hypothetical protein n=1 Tax=Corynebacterium afermentans TaxID=38286 RepID=UPI00188AC5F7|nr:hypothetical protein [Corynebacterium afermentans]MBF4547200.1 hypothetical protein [Corynebacterium afermentans subsp. lipophilum]WJY59924.1 hypothetical protein CAFEL_10950 [Corynebacterium afermentans subsp. lipophilum]